MREIRHGAQFLPSAMLWVGRTSSEWTEVTGEWPGRNGVAAFAFWKLVSDFHARTYFVLLWEAGVYHYTEYVLAVCVLRRCS